MKKNILVCGLISGALVTSFMMYGMLRCYNDVNFSSSMLLGYASMLLAFSLVFVGIKNARDKYGDGTITFGKAFKTGFLISLIASTLYVLGWMLEYYFFLPDFMDKYRSAPTRPPTRHARDRSSSRPRPHRPQEAARPTGRAPRHDRPGEAGPAAASGRCA